MNEIKETLVKIENAINNKSYRYAKDQTKHLWKLLGTKINANANYNKIETVWFEEGRK